MSEIKVVIASACRTPIGAFNGALSTLTAPQLGSIVIREALSRAGLKGEDVSEVIMGEVLTAGVGQAPARQASIGAGIPNTVPCMTINKVCGSSLKAVMLAAQAIQTGDADIVVAGGMESMSNAPYLLDKARSGYRLGHGVLTDSLIKDGLWDMYNDFHMGDAAELCAREYDISREVQDEFAIESYKKAQAAQEKGYFRTEIVPVTVEGRKGTVVVSEDEEPAGCVVMSDERARALGIEPLASIAAHTSVAREPEWFTLAPAKAIPQVLIHASLELSDIDLFEINEAFAVVNLAVGQELGLDMSRVNVHGGAVALGHPIGASGARILVTLLYARHEALRPETRAGVSLHRRG